MVFTQLISLKCIVVLILTIKVRFSSTTDFGCESDSSNVCYSFLNDSNFQYFKEVDEKNCHVGVPSCVLRDTYISSSTTNEEQKKYLRVYFYKADLPRIPERFFEDFPSILYLDIYSSGFLTLSSEDLKNANKLIDLEIRKNNLSSLSSNVFDFAPNLQRLAITDNQKMTVHENTFTNLKNLRILSLEESKIEFIPDELLKGKSLMTELSFFWNKLKSINDIIFKDLLALTKLDINSNEIVELHENAFENLENLIHLDIKRNKIPILRKATFKNLKYLKVLEISENRLTNIDPELFHNLPNLVDLDMNGNELESLPDGLFKNNPRLKTLDIRINKLKYIQKGTFEGAKSLEHLNMWGNKIQKVSASSFSNLEKLNYLNLENNICVKRTWVPKYEKAIKSSVLEEFFTNSDCAICVVPEVPNGEIVSALFGDSFGEFMKKFQTARVQCNSGYSYLEDGDDTVTCDGEGFNKEFRECIKLCPGNETIDYTTQSKCFYNETDVPCNRDQAPGTQAQVYCGVGYHLPEQAPGSKLLTCLEGGKWNSQAIKCKPICGRLTAKSVAYVLGGQDAQITDVPWAAAIHQLMDGSVEYICAGTILTKRIVVSASHCFFDEKLKKFQSVDQYKVTVGKYYRDYDATESYASQKFNLTELRPVSGYKGYDGFFISDFAILILDDTIDFQPHVVPICINIDVKYGVQRVVPAGDKGIVAGWGFTEFDGVVSNTLKSIEMPVINFKQCRQESGEFERFVTPDKFCSGYKNGSGVCRGDSGGGLVFPQMEDGQEVYYIRGVVSNTRQGAQGGCDKWYTLFTNVLEFLPNIKNAVDDFP